MGGSSIPSQARLPDDAKEKQEEAERRRQAELQRFARGRWGAMGLGTLGPVGAPLVVGAG